MKVFLIFCLIAVTIYISYKIFDRSKSSSDKIETPSSDSIFEIAPWAYAQAVADALENYMVSLDGSDNSVKEVENILDKIDSSGKKPNGELKEGVRGMAIIYGVYIGECIVRNHGGIWGNDHEVAGAKSYPIKHAKGESFPTSWAYKRIVNGDEDNVWHKYQLLVLSDSAINLQTGDTAKTIQPPR